MFRSLVRTPFRSIPLLALVTALVAVVATTLGSRDVPAAASPGVDVTKDLDYAAARPAGTQGHKLDLYVPKSRPPVPLVIFTHGSGWMADNGRMDADKVAAQLNPHGFAVAGVAVRSSSQARFPAQLHDIKGAIRWLRANAAKYHLDPRRFAIMGESSGGWATTMAAVTGDVPELEGTVGVNGPSSAVQAALPFYPPIDFRQMDAHMLTDCTPREDGSVPGECHADPHSPESRLLGCALNDCPDKVAEAGPLTYIGKRRTPPFLIFHGKQDQLVPYHQSRLLFDKLAATHKDARFYSFPNTGHGTFLEMLSDADTQRGATLETTRHGHLTRPVPAHPSWQTVVAFLKSQLHTAGR
ncbi:alpha/beta hydrolase fold domain-containing protein [Streptomyces sioyaensis]|uniref:alpha/beta hydrolase fold domain-containing protein n=1 Tax=Streptomyces sioyaensis TaxID=67364 RepID=UPI003D766481